jgi:hypothetical protein
MSTNELNPSLLPGQQNLEAKILYRCNVPCQKELITVPYANGTTTVLVKRLMGGRGKTIIIRNETVSITDPEFTDYNDNERIQR